ncbi:flavin reductase family protein [Deferribacteraceae bacterium V6Fe1]|nr:flavin reductase family protein [Deferribacteraceae bacterium V6Fe1]
MFKNIKPEDLRENAFEAIGKKWMLITPSNSDGIINPMTASWGGFGVMWNKNVAYIVIRPTRYTYELIEKTRNFTLTFFEEEYRKTLSLCGSKSGRDIDKVKESGLNPIIEDNFVYYNECSLAIFSKKLYFTDFNPNNFLDAELDKLYPKKDYHRLYIGEIVKIKSL